MILPLAVPGLAAGSIFTFSLTLGDYIAPSLVGGPGSSLIGTVVFENLGLANNLPFAAAFATIPLAIMAVYLALMKRLGAFEIALMETRATRVGLWAWAALIFPFLWIPLAIMALYAFNSSNIQSWPIPGFSTKWFSEAWNDEEVRTALWLSFRAGLLATAVALVLGSLAAFGLARTRFFGRDSISFLFVLPIALPGIITGLALNSFFVLWGVSFSLWTIVIGHATFCVVVVYNNVLARLRRTSGSFFEASADLGATGFQTFRYVTLPGRRDGARRRRAARVRALVGRDRRHVLHRGRAEHAAAAHLRLHPAGPEPADRERDRARRDRRRRSPSRSRSA